MYSIAAIFKPENEDLWKNLESSCISSGLLKTKIQHFSWQTAETYDFEKLRIKLTKVCGEISPFHFHTAGLGIFPDPRKVIFLIIAKNRQLLDLHQDIWNETVSLGSGVNSLYSPDNWIPHISLNLNDLSSDQFYSAIKELSKRTLNFEFYASEVSLLYLTTTTSGIDSTYPFKKEG